MNYIPLRSPKEFLQYTPEEYKDYVISLHQVPEAKVPKEKKEVSISLNKKGSIVVRITREPKFITRTEVLTIANDLRISYQDLWLQLKKRKITLRST